MESNNDGFLNEEENTYPLPPPPKMKELASFRSIPNPEEDDAYLSGSLYGESEVDEIPLGYEDGQASLKRPAEEIPVPRAFKRIKGILNTDYLDVLNADIQDTAHRVCASEEADIESSQFGVTFWSSAEKKLFFEAAARLGRDDLPGIAAFIGTKSEIEVNHYLSILRRAQFLRQREGLRPTIEFPEYPSAVELSQPLCHALDEAADAISVRQEHKEQQREEAKWGENWDITTKVVQRIDKSEDTAEARLLPFAGIFNIINWLRLSDRIFMNSSIPSDNWQFIDDHPPSIWATTFEDFHSLAVSFTRRLVQTTIFLSMSRIHAKKELIPTTRDIVTRRDVEAAIASLGLTPNSSQFWIKCARRLRLEVHEEPPDRDDDGEQEALSYEEVEEALQTEDQTPEGGKTQSLTDHVQGEGIFSGEQLGEEHFRAEQILQDDVSNESESESSVASEQGEDDEDDEEAAINHEANEVLQFSAADFPETYRTRQSLQNRVAAERRQEQYAEERDQYLSWQAEADMWELLQRKPPMELPKMREPGALQRSKLDLESLFPIGRDWRARTRYRAEWELEEVPGKPEDR